MSKKKHHLRSKENGLLKYSIKLLPYVNLLVAVLQAGFTQIKLVASRYCAILVTLSTRFGRALKRSCSCPNHRLLIPISPSQACTWKTVTQ